MVKRMKFRVIDNKTGKEADAWNIALHEKWAQSLVYCDMEGFAITEDGTLVLMDECGHSVYCDAERFKVVFEEERPSGDPRDRLKEVFREASEIGGDLFHLSQIERIIDGEDWL